MKTILLAITTQIILEFLSLTIIYGQTSWIQSDWSGQQYSITENVDPDVSGGELLLLNDPSNMVFAFAPTNLEGIWDMEIYADKLFLAACTAPVAIDGGEVLSYDYAANNFQWEYNVWEQGVIQLRKYNDKLYIPGVDSQGSWDWGNIYIYDGNEWVRKETVPHGLHVFDLIFFNDAMYVTTGTDLNNYSGIVYKSTDDGDSFTEVFSVSAVGSDSRRFYMMGIYNDTLYIQSDTKLPEGNVVFRFDGSNWTSIPFDSLAPSVGKLQEYEDKFYYLNGRFLHIYNGLEWNTVNLPFSGMTYSTSTGKRVARGLGFYKDTLYGGGGNGLLYSSPDGNIWEICSSLGNTFEEIESIQVYHGRLYVGVNDTTSSGKVYVSASAPEGSLISRKHNFGMLIGAGTIQWTALTPGETLVKFQLRTATSETGLESKDFTGPDGTVQSYYESSGEPLSVIHQNDTWMQYKACLSTTDNALSPVLQEVNISISSVNIPDANNDKDPQYSIYPNPASKIVYFNYKINVKGQTICDLYSISGRRIKQLIKEEQMPGKYELEIDISDLPNGIYYIRLQADHQAGGGKVILLK